MVQTKGAVKWKKMGDELLADLTTDREVAVPQLFVDNCEKTCSVESNAANDSLHAPNVCELELEVCVLFAHFSYTKVTF